MASSSGFGPPDGQGSSRPALPRFGWEIALVLALSLGRSGVYAVVDLIARLSVETPLGDQTVALNPIRSPRPYLDLTYQLLSITFALVPVVLALYLLATRPSPGQDWRAGMGLNWRARDLSWGLAIFAAVGIPGLGFYLLGRALGITVEVQASALGTYWWTVPVLVLAALQNGILEEVLVVGYLFERTRGWAGWVRRGVDWRFVALSAGIRGSYHLYQGIGPGLANAAMGVGFAVLFQSRWGRRRVIPLVIAHTLLDVVAFVGYALAPAAWLRALGG